MEKQGDSYLLRTVSKEDCFRFYSEIGKPTGDTACSTGEFEDKLQSVPIQSVTFHFKRQDFQNWFKTTIGDDELATNLNKIKTTLQGEDLRQALLKKIQTRINELNMTRQDLYAAIGAAAYTVAVLVVTTYFFVGVWPSTEQDVALNATTRQVRFYGTGLHLPIGSETSLVFIMMFAGILGACVFSLFAISHHLGVDRDFDRAWSAWYYLRPLIGGGLGLIFFLLLRGGVLTINAGVNNLNLVGLASVTALVGMFAEHAMHKLQDLADTLFGTAPESAKSPASGTSSATTTSATTK